MNSSFKWHFYFRRLALGLIFLTIGIGIGVYVQPLFGVDVDAPDIHEFNTSYKFVSPLLSCGADADISFEESRTLESELRDVIKKHEDAGDITDASIYFKDVHGPWVGINENESFAPGSLLKLPLAMSVYRKAEDDPTFLLKKLSYTGNEASNDQNYPAIPLPAGTYTPEELISQMLTQSDNSAANVLANAVGVSDFQATYDRLGIQKPTEGDDQYTLTTKTYASFLHALYNASYVSTADSERLLSVLSKSVFRDGLIAGVPNNVVVSHKFGERSFSDSEDKQLHDCGIVYAPKHPYILCVMTHGADYADMATFIADASYVAYHYVTK